MPKRSSIIVTLVACIFVLVFLAIARFTKTETQAAAQSQSPTPLTTIKASNGGMITYGHVDGATTQAQAMANILKILHQNLGDRPQVGKLFKLKNTDTVAVFYTVVNHPAGNLQLAGLLIAANAGPNNIEAALVSDDSKRFKSTVNPMLQQLFAAWHPAGLASSSQASANSSNSTSSAHVQSGPAPHLNTVSTQDRSATIGLPDGWQLDPSSANGMLIIHGPGGESVALNLNRTAIDTNNPQARQYLARGIRVPRTIYFPYSPDVDKNFVPIFQQWRASNNLAPAQFKIDFTENVPTAQGVHCTHVKGQMNPDGKGMQSMNTMMCISDPQQGYFTVRLNHSLVPLNKADADRSTISAIANSLHLDTQILNAQAADANKAAAIRTKTQIDQIHAIGDRATANYNATQARNDQQHAAYWAQQDTNARQSTSFQNYTLDQTVIQDNNMYNNGTVGHGTVWNSTADALIKADPNRFETVNQPNYWKGVDY